MNNVLFRVGLPRTGVLMSRSPRFGPILVKGVNFRATRVFPRPILRNLRITEARGSMNCSWRGEYLPLRAYAHQASPNRSLHGVSIFPFNDLFLPVLLTYFVLCYLCADALLSEEAEAQAKLILPVLSADSRPRKKTRAKKSKNVEPDVLGLPAASFWLSRLASSALF